MRSGSLSARHVQPGDTRRPSPRAVNLAAVCGDGLADGSARTALFHLRRDGRAERITFDALRANSARLAQVLSGWGIRRGDRVGILLPQGPEALLAPLAALRIGAIAAPFARSLPPEGLAARMLHAGCAALVTDAAGLPALAAIRHRLPSLRLVLCTDGAAQGALSLWQEMERARADFPALAIEAGAPALLLYGAAPTGAPRGVLHAHRALSGHVPGLQAGQLLWAPGDWAGRGGLLDAVLPALGRGVPVLTVAMEGIEPERALRILARGDVGAAVLPAATLRRLRRAVTSRPIQRLPALATFDGPLGADLRDELRDAIAGSVIEAHALPECGVIAATDPADDALPPGSAGRAAPGRRIAVLGPDGMPLPAGRTSTIALRRPDPGIFLGYWQDPAATAAAFRGPWLLTGEDGTLDTEGRLSPEAKHALPEDTGAGRADVEHCLRQHPAVAMAALICAAEAATAGEATAVVIPRPEARPGPGLAAELRDFLRARLAGDQCPRRVAFAAALPADPAGPTPLQVLGRTVGTGAYGAQERGATPSGSAPPHYPAPGSRAPGPLPSCPRPNDG